MILYACAMQLITYRLSHTDTELNWIGHTFVCIIKEWEKKKVCIAWDED